MQQSPRERVWFSGWTYSYPGVICRNFLEQSVERLHMYAAGVTEVPRAIPASLSSKSHDLPLDRVKHTANLSVPEVQISCRFHKQARVQKRGVQQTVHHGAHVLGVPRVSQALSHA